MTINQTQPESIAIVKWGDLDEIAEAVDYELCNLGFSTSFFRFDEAAPLDVNIIFSFAPYGRFLPIVHQLAQIPAAERPILIHWNTEGIPDLRIPWTLMKGLSIWRSWQEKWLSSILNPKLLTIFPFSFMTKRMLRFRYVGDYYYAYRKGILNIFADSSAVYAQLYNHHGLPAIHAPWGSTPGWYADLNLARDIDVLWIGKRGSRRRRKLIDRIRDELRQQGYNIHIADNEESPFVYRQDRIELLNRAKITLNITRTWYDDNFSRFALAAPNRSLIVSEEMLPHCPAYEANVHYISAPREKLVETILYYLQHPDQRVRIVENAYLLSTRSLTFQKSIKAIMEGAFAFEQSRVS